MARTSSAFGSTPSGTDAGFWVRVEDKGLDPYDPDVVDFGDASIENMRKLRVEYTMGVDYSEGTNADDGSINFGFYAETINNFISNLRSELISFISDRTDMPERAVQSMLSNTTVLNGVSNLDLGLTDSHFSADITANEAGGSLSTYNDTNGMWEWSYSFEFHVPVIRIPYHPSMEIDEFFRDHLPDAVSFPQMEWSLHVHEDNILSKAVYHRRGDFPLDARMNIDPDWFIEYEDVGDQYCFMSIGEDWERAATITNRLESMLRPNTGGTTSPVAGVAPPPDQNEGYISAQEAIGNVENVYNEVSNTARENLADIQNIDSILELAPNPGDISIPEQITEQQVSSGGANPQQRIQDVADQVREQLDNLSNGEVIDNLGDDHISALMDQSSINMHIARLEDALDSLRRTRDLRDEVESIRDSLNSADALQECISSILSSIQEALDKIGNLSRDLPWGIDWAETLTEKLGGELPEPPDPPSGPIDCMDEYNDIGSTIEEARSAPEDIELGNVSRRDILDSISRARNNVSSRVQENNCVQQFNNELGELKTEVEEVRIDCSEAYDGIQSSIEDLQGAADRIEGGETSRQQVRSSISDLRSRVTDEVGQDRCISEFRSSLDDVEVNIASARLDCDEAYNGLVSRISNFEASVEEFIALNPIQRATERRGQLVSEGRGLLDDIDGIESPCDSKFRSRVRSGISNLQGARIIGQDRLPCASRFGDLDDRISEMENISENISRGNVQRDVQSVIDRVEDIREDARQIEDQECIDQFVQRLSIATRDIESVERSVRVDSDIADQLSQRREDVIQEFRARYEDI